MKSVLISIRPQWCEKIANGTKTIEVRKTRPKLETPFKCYIYCTKGRGDCLWRWDGIWYDTQFPNERPNRLDGKVIGEFVCDKILDIFISCSDPNMKGLPFPCTGLTDREIMDYLGNGKAGYGWHISDLVIYDTPKVLSQFVTEGDCDCDNCHKCYWLDRGNGYNVEDDCNLVYDYKPLFRPPQSWCYVEGGED